MDAGRFDTFTRSLTRAGSRRRALSGVLLGSLGLLGWQGGAGVDAHDLSKKCKKKSGKAKKKCLKKAKKHKGEHADETPLVRCSPSCAGKRCGDNGCGGSCGTCCSFDAPCPHRECQWCDGTACVTDASAVGRPCSSATCEGGRLGICDSTGQCQCQAAPTCTNFPDSCGECQRCNDTATACEVDPPAVGRPCSSATCESGMEGICNATGQCECRPDVTCDPDSCGECQWCNDTGTACEPAPFAEGTPCSSATCEGGTQGICVSGQCQCQAAATGAAA